MFQYDCYSQMAQLFIKPTMLSMSFYYMSRVMRKPYFCLCENRGADQLRSNFVFATWIVLFLFFLNPKFQASNHPLWLHRPVCIGHARKIVNMVVSLYRHFQLTTRLMELLPLHTCNAYGSMQLFQ